MPGSQDPSLWQALLDSRFAQLLLTVAATAFAVGAAVRGFLRRHTPKTREDAELKERLEVGVIKQIAHDLAGLHKGQQDLRERVVRIETILERQNGRP